MQVCSRPLNCACFRSGWILEPSITTTRSRRLRRISLALSLVFACSLSATALAKETEAEKAAKEAAAQEKLLQVFVRSRTWNCPPGPDAATRCSTSWSAKPRSTCSIAAPTGSRCATNTASKAGHARATCAARELADGSPFVFHLGDRAGFTSHDWEIGFGGGDYGGANLISVYGAYSLTDNMKVELTGGAIPRQRIDWLEGRARPHTRDRSRNGGCRRSWSSARASCTSSHAPPSFCPKTAPTRRRMWARGCVFISPGVSSFAPTIAGTRYSRAAMTIRSWKNGKF